MTFKTYHFARAILVGMLLAGASADAAASDFQGCPAEGDATIRGRSDPENNVLKNRDTEPKDFEAVSFESVVALPIDGANKRHRTTWPRAFLKTVEKNEARAVSIDGFLLGIKQEGLESPNCHAKELRDFHLWLGPSSDSAKRDSIVVEITPRVRSRRPGWKLKTLQHLAKDRAKLRVSCYIFLDPEHPDQIGKSRATIYEIHPILRIEVWSAGKWVEL